MQFLLKMLLIMKTSKQTDFSKFIRKQRTAKLSGNKNKNRETTLHRNPPVYYMCFVIFGMREKHLSPIHPKCDPKQMSTVYA